MSGPMRALAGLLIVGLMTGCSGGKPEESVAKGRDAHELRPDELIIALQSDGKSLDPHTVNDAASMRLVENMYSTLLRYGPDYGSLEPDLAVRWSQSDDHLSYTLHLRTNAVFHDGRPVTADDVIYSIERIRETGARAYMFESIASMTADHPHQVTITLTGPLAPFLTYLAHPMNAIVNRAVAEASRLDRADGGSGPFRLATWKNDQHLILEAFDDYFISDRPRLRRLVYRPISDETARSIALRNGEIDIILDIAAKDMNVLSRQSDLVITSVPGTFWEYVGLNCARPPFDDVRIRQAIAHAIDRAMINKMVKFGRATELTGGHLPPNHWAHADLSVYPQPDLEKARQLLEAAGAGQGFSATILVGSAFPYQVKAAEIIKQQLRPLGIDLTVQALESGVFFDALNRNDFDMTLVGWLGFVDPDEWTYNLFRTGARWNQQGYSNPQVDELLDRGRALMDQAERMPVYAEVQRLVATEAPMIFLYVNNRAAAMLDSVRDFHVHPTVTTISLRDAYREPHAP